MSHKFTVRSCRTFLFRLLTLAVLLAPLVVLAQDSMFSPERLQPAEKDVSVRLLRGILGLTVDKIRLADTLGTADAGAFGGLFRTFNGFLLLVVGLLVFVKAVMALLDTAREGDPLGRERSTTWTPLRLVFAVGLLLPLVNGFALAQIIVLWLTLSGVGLANAVWDTAVDQFAKTALYSEPPPAQARQLAVAMLASNVCELIVNDLPARGETKYTVTLQSATNGVGAYNERSDRWSAEGLGEAACGGFAIREPAEGLRPQQGISGWELWDDYMQWLIELVSFGEDTRVAFSRELLAAHELSALALRDELKPLAQRLFEGKGDLGECVTVATGPLGGGRCLSALDAAAEHYALRLKGLILGVVNLTGQRAFTDFSARAKEEGWLTAGSWFYRFMALTDYMNKLALNVPEPYPIRIWEKLPREDVETYAHLFKRLEAVVLEAETDGGLGLLRASGDPHNSVLDDFSRNTLRATLDWIAQGLLGKTHPLFAISWLGHALLAAVLVGLGIGHAASVAKIIATKSGAGRLAQALGGLTDLLTGPSESNTFTMASLVLGMVVLALLGFALTAALYLPLAPFIVWTVACLHWLLRVFEALVAAPVWAIVFLKNGKGLTGEAMTGWLLLLALLLTPTLMVLGLLAATVISYGLLSLLAGVFVTVAINATSGNVTGPVILIGLLIVFVLWAMDLTLRSFSLIHRLPEASLRWVGGHLEGAVDYHQLQHDIRQGLEAGRQAGLNAAGKLMGHPPTGEKPPAKVKPMGGDKTPGD